MKLAENIWAEIKDIVEPDICYEILGFDVMLGRKLKPYLLEVNQVANRQSSTH